MIFHIGTRSYIDSPRAAGVADFVTRGRIFPPAQMSRPACEHLTQVLLNLHIRSAGGVTQLTLPPQLEQALMRPLLLFPFG